MLGRALQVNLPVAVGACAVEPHQAAAERNLVVLVLTGQQVDELRRASFDGAAAVGVRRNDALAECLQSFVAVGVEELWRVGLRRRGSLLRHDHAVRMLSRLQRDDAQHRSCGRAQGQGS